MLPQLFGHRGARPAPENTMAAFREAVRQGVRAIETDFHETSDQNLVVMHDGHVDRMTDGQGAIKDLSLEQVQALKIEGRHPVPTIDDVLSFAKSESLYVDVEVKCPRNVGVEGRIASKLRQHGMEQSAVVTADDPEFLRRMKGEMPAVPTGLVMRAKPLYKPAALLAAGAAMASGLTAGLLGGPVALAALGGLVVGGSAAFHGIKRHLQHKGLSQGSDHLMPHWLLVDRHLMSRASEQGREVVPYGVNGEKRGERLKQLGVHGLITDYPERFKEFS